MVGDVGHDGKDFRGRPLDRDVGLDPDAHDTIVFAADERVPSGATTAGISPPRRLQWPSAASVSGRWSGCDDVELGEGRVPVGLAVVPGPNGTRRTPGRRLIIRLHDTDTRGVPHRPGTTHGPLHGGD